MIYYYSASTSGFYLKDVHGDNMPEDVIEVTEEEHFDLFSEKAIGYEIKPDENGKPHLVPIPPPPEEVLPELTYADLRRAEYPPIADYIDGVVKGDQTQIDAYIAACLAVKDKYPKV